MTDLLNIAKECGAIKTFRGITFTDHELHATVEKVCGPLVEALKKIESGGEGVYKWSMTKAEITAQLALASYKELIGQDK